MRANYPTFDVMSAAFFYSQLKHPISEFLRPFEILSAKKRRNGRTGKGRQRMSPAMHIVCVTLKQTCRDLLTF